MSRGCKARLIIIIGVLAAVIISGWSEKWLEYMCTLAAFSVFAGIIGGATKDKVKRAGWFTFFVGTTVAVVLGVVFDNGGGSC
ncbi:hypothetical protein KKC06_04755, partial [Patescibacteria group bacterium]|nr:hypothetical protein [Patescibacteria group bacterium]